MTSGYGGRTCAADATERADHMAPTKRPSSVEIALAAARAEIERLQRDLWWTRMSVLDLAPESTHDALAGCLSCQSPGDVFAWQQAAIEQVMLFANAHRSEEMGDYPGRWPRAYCPLCGRGADVRYVKGFAVPSGLESHLAGTFNSRQCAIFKAAFGIAIEMVRQVSPPR